MQHPFGGALTKERFEAIAKYGCGWCQADVAWGDVGVTVYDRDEIVVCAKCSSNGEKETNKIVTTRMPTFN